MKLIIFIACSFEDSQTFFMQSLPMYTLGLFSMPLNGDILGIEKLVELCLLTFVVDYFSGLFVQFKEQ